MSFYVGDGGQHRLVKEVYAGDGGQHRLVKEAWVGEGGQWRKFFQLNPVTGLQVVEDFTRCPLTSDWSITVLHSEGATIVVEMQSDGGAWAEIDRRTVSGNGQYTFTEPAFAGPPVSPVVNFRAYAVTYGSGNAVTSGPHQAVGCP